MTADLAGWLIEQIEADEEVARATESRKWDAVADFVEADDRDGELPNVLICQVDDDDRRIDGEPTRARAKHIARWDPARVLAECAAKRQLVESHWDGTPDPEYPELLQADCPDCRQIQPCRTLRMLAQPYRDRPGYQPEWDVE